MTATTLKIASPESIAYLVTLIEERTEQPVTAEQFVGFTQAKVSDMIERCLQRPALPATPEQLQQIAGLAQQLGRGTLVTKDRGQASRQIRSMQADLKARAEGRKPLDAARAADADAQLDAIFAPVVTTPVVESDDIPF